MSDHDDVPLSQHELIQSIGMEIAETTLACPATAIMSETDQNIWTYIAEGGIDDGINDELWANRIFEGLYLLNRVERGDWTVHDTDGRPVAHWHERWIADGGPRGKDMPDG
jgi:hypothetical protein